MNIKENIYAWRKNRCNLKYNIEDFRNHDELKNSLLDMRVYGFDFTGEV